jgi:hypothetical protein
LKKWDNLEKKKKFIQISKEKPKVSLQLWWWHLTYRHLGCSALSQRPSEFLAAHVTLERTITNSKKGQFICVLPIGAQK